MTSSSVKHWALVQTQANASNDVRMAFLMLQVHYCRHSRKKLVGIEIHDKAIPRAGYPVELEDGTEVGVVTTGYHSISLDRSICFALVKTEYSKLGTPLSIRIRKKTFPGEVVKKRFYQTNYKK